ncbi:MAG TPA: argininosuccinate lyase [Dissulfurispiraceae bacterium]|nr:argininosuccinate lyase [Dissulfurispiraceae bacterium]
MKKPWAGRFTEQTSKAVEAFTESISFDRRLWRHDIDGSIAHAKMLAKQGIIPKNDAEKIVAGLQEIAREIERGDIHFRVELEDIHMNIEMELIKKIGHIGGRLHTARSRNDQVALDLRLYLRAETHTIIGLLGALTSGLADTAEKNIDVIMPGFTHLQRAQPVLLAHHLMAYAHMFERDRQRFLDGLKRINILPLGSCALAGTSLPIDRDYVAKLLGFDAVSENSMDAVSDRDFAIEFVSCAAICIMHVSRVSEDLILWSSEEFAFVELPDAFTTGSSIMPQKKNPDVAELMRGSAGKIYGDLMNLLTLMKGLPLAYNRDMQHDKEPVFQTVDVLTRTLTILADMVPRLGWNKERMLSTADASFSTATDVAEYLVRKGVPFRTAHEVTGKMVRFCIDCDKKLAEITLDEFKRFAPEIGKDIYSVLSARESVNARSSFGGTAPAMVKEQIKRFRKKR